VAGLATAWLLWPRGLAPLAVEEDPRLTFATPYHNVRPEVSYVGDEVCAGCHAGHAETYRQHPMGRSTAPVAHAAALERYDAAANNPFEKLGFHFRVERRGDRVFHKESRRDAQGRALTEFEAEVEFAIGSGRRGRTYLIHRNGYLFQSLLSWYAQKGVWDFTPGFELAEHFERPARLSCLFCHSNRVEPVPHTVNHYRPPLFRGHAIGCERCHGPGELHVRLREGGEGQPGLDPTIVNPRRLEPALRDAVCQQCHLQGESRVVCRGRELFDYRPGLPLHLFLSVFVRAAEFADDQTTGSHTEQVYASRCFRESRGQLGCISCHDPHALPAPEEKVDYYRGRCLSCHEEKGCGLAPAVRREQNPADDCTACHMPRTGSKIVHDAITDHRIRRRPDGTARASAPPRRLLPGEVPLVPFHRDLVDPSAPGVSRDLGLALCELGQKYPALGRPFGQRALPLLEAAVQAAPEDVPAWEDLGFTWWRLGHKEDALAALETALAKAPARELTLTYAAVLAASLGRSEAALGYWQRAVAVNPEYSPYRHQLARLLAERRQWAEALKECEAALRLNPAGEEARSLRITCLLRTGDQARARAEFDTLLRLNPTDEERLRRWFVEQLR
jgi:Flp pilus assembly protein TadD